MSDRISVAYDIAKPFLPSLIQDVAESLLRIKELYNAAQHSNETVKLLVRRISVVDRIIDILETSETIEKDTYSSLQDLNQVLREMRDYIEQITQPNTLLKFLKAKEFEVEFKNLCRKYDSIMISLNVSLSLNQVINKVDEEKENKILKEDINEALRFQSAMVESIVESVNKTNESVNKTNEKVEKIEAVIGEVIGEVSKYVNTMKKLKGANQKRIDDIFNDSIMLPYDDYIESDDKPRKEVLRKYEHIKTREEYAFKSLNKGAKNFDVEVFNKLKNQVTILKKLEKCQNIIRFFGFALDDSIGKYYLVTEWAEKGNLREYIEDKRSKGQNIETEFKIRFAYDIAKGLNFLNAVKIVHRDIRAENIVITLHDAAKITNFYVSRTFEEPTAKLTADHECFRYCAPEILRRKLAGEEENDYDKYNMKCEVYSFGIILWEIAESRVPYEQFKDFREAVKIIIGGYRESFTPDTDIPEKYRNLVNRAVEQEPSRRPIISKMLTELRDLCNLYQNPQVSHPDNVRTPVRKSTADQVSSAIDKLDKAIEEHKKNPRDPNGKSELYELFNAFASIGVPRAKYWKAYYIQKGFSDLTCSEDEKNKEAVKLFKEAADSGYVEAQNRYGFLVKQGIVVKKNEKEAIEYFEKAANNNHVEAMFNLAICYLDNGESIMGRYYLTMAASNNFPRAINRCKEMNISY